MEHPFFTRFPTGRAILPVVHVINESQAKASAKIAHECGADGIFLIEHGRHGATFLRDVYEEVRTESPEMWIGLNYLDQQPQDAFSRFLPTSVNGYWSDNLGVTNPCPKSAEHMCAERVVTAHSRSKARDALHFAGVAFKYQLGVRDDQLGQVAKIASKILGITGVVTTSGTGTGSAPDVEKTELMREHMGDFPLAVASGITPENAGQYLPSVNAFLVATSITGTDEVLVPERLKALVSAIRS